MKLYSDEELAEILDQPIFHQISDATDRLGVECYVVGGYVRDIFLERPSNDIDVVVVGKPHPPTHSPRGEGERFVSAGISVAQELKRMLGHKAHLSVFKNFGTAQVKMGDEEVEFVGARRESYSHDSRKPIVEDGTLEDDQNRRDFTINAMAICLNKERFGQLVDPFNGLADLEDGIIATPLDPAITFSDDPLRMMRCIRFATQLNFQIEDETFKALERMADRIKIVSGERIEVELNKIIMSPHPSKGFVDLQRSGLLNIILPELAALDIVEQRNGRAHKNNFYHTLEVLENIAAPSRGLWLRWAALLHDIGKTKSKRWDPAVGWTFHNHNFIGAKMVPDIFRRLKMPMGAEMKYVQKLVDLHMRPQVIADSEVTDSAVRRLLNDAGDDIDDLMLLCEADITSKNEVKKKMFLENFRMVREKLTDLKEKDYKRLLQPVIDGNEIMELFHLKPSREVGTLKQTLKDAVLDNKVENKREPLMQLLIQKAREMGLVLITLLTLTGCFKEEPLNTECDILEAFVSVDDPEAMFFQITDTLVRVKSEDSRVVFTVRHAADLTQLAPRFSVTEGAVISPASGTVQDFSHGPVIYTVTSQDKQWQRRYEVEFQPVTVTVTEEVAFDFEHFALDSDYQKYYTWYEETDGRKEMLWATGNGGYSIANGSKAAMEYPSVPSDEGLDGHCVKLVTLDTGPLGRSTGRPIAAGNLFLGAFNISKALLDALHATEMGVPFTNVPIKLTGYYKYQPGPEFKNKKQEIVSGMVDCADIYSVLYRNQDDEGHPVVLYGDNVLTSPLIVRKARIPKVETCSDWTYFEIDYEQLGEVDEELLTNRGYNLALVFSSSIRGDQFEGAIGSTLFIDKVRIICTHNE